MLKILICLLQVSATSYASDYAVLNKWDLHKQLSEEKFECDYGSMTPLKDFFWEGSALNRMISKDFHSEYDNTHYTCASYY